MAWRVHGCNGSAHAVLRPPGISGATRQAADSGFAKSLLKPGHPDGEADVPAPRVQCSTGSMPRLLVRVVGERALYGLTGVRRADDAAAAGRQNPRARHHPGGWCAISARETAASAAACRLRSAVGGFRRSEPNLMPVDGPAQNSGAGDPRDACRIAQCGTRRITRSRMRENYDPGAPVRRMVVTRQERDLSKRQER